MSTPKSQIDQKFPVRPKSMQKEYKTNLIDSSFKALIQCADEMLQYQDTECTTDANTTRTTISRSKASLLD